MQHRILQKLFSLMIVFLLLFGFSIKGFAAGRVYTYPETSAFTTNQLGVNVDNTFTVYNLFSEETKLSGGWLHHCAVANDDTLKCWGVNDNGELGIGNTTNKNFPQSVIGISDPVLTVQGSSDHTCALTTTGKIYCSGYNDVGQLGDGTTTQRTTFVQVAGITDATSIGIGYRHGCATLSSGGIKCWGWNAYNQLGDGTNTNRFAPTMVSGTTGSVYSKVVATEISTCSMNMDGQVKCWGYNGEGQLGDGTNVQRSTPVDVQSFEKGVRSIYSGQGRNFCGIDFDSSVWCWGAYGNNGTNSNIPVKINGISNAKILSVGQNHACAVTYSGELKCWGDNGYQKATGIAGGTNWNATSVTGITGAMDVSTTDNTTCVTLSSGGLKCWGYNGYGQIGDSTNTDRYIPTTVTGYSTSGIKLPTSGDSLDLTNFSLSGADASKFTIVSGSCLPTPKTLLPNGSCTLNLRFTTSNWGDFSGSLDISETAINDTGSTLSGRAIDLLTTSPNILIYPGAVHFPNIFTGESSTTTVSVVNYALGPQSITNALYHTCAITSVGGVKCWGLDDQGQLGNGATTGYQYSPVDVIGLNSKVIALTSARFHTCALLDTGHIQCWGLDDQGQLGNGAVTGYQYQAGYEVVGITNAVAISASTYHTCAVLNDGSVKCWGLDDQGQLGNGAITGYQYSPVQVVGLTSGAIAIATGEQHSCALMNNGKVKCWGTDAQGQLGNGYTLNSTQYSPVDVIGLSDATAISASLYNTCAITLSGGVKCWGLDDQGQLGNGATTGYEYSPVDVSGLSSGVVDISSAIYHTCAVLNTGAMKCWGLDDQGQLGNGTASGHTAYQYSPDDVLIINNAVAVSTSQYNTCAVLSSGSIKCWGLDDQGQVGNGPVTGYQYSPTDVSGLTTGAKVPATVAALNLSSLGISGINSSDFSITGGTCSDTTVLGANQGCTINLLFTSSTLGAKNASLDITSNDQDSLNTSKSLIGEVYATPGGIFKPLTVDNLVNGVSYTRYDGNDSVMTDGISDTVLDTGYVNSLTNPEIYFEHDQGDYFSLELNTNLRITNPGVYEFKFIVPDDFAYLAIDGVQRINHNGYTGGDSVTVAVNLTAGDHPLLARIHETWGTTRLLLNYRGTVAGLDAGTSFIAIPDSKLFISPRGPSAWHKADMGVTATEGGNVSAWEDSGINNNDLSLANGNPTFYGTTSGQLFNFNPVINFTDDQLQSSDHINGFSFGKQSKSSFSVVSKTGYNVGNGLIFAQGQDNCTGCSYYMNTIGANVLFDIWGSIVTSNNFFTSTESNTPKLISGVGVNNNILSTNNANVFNNGKQSATGTLNWGITANNEEDYSIGFHNDYQLDGLDGKIVEVIQYPWALTNLEKLRVESYLAAKYGLTLSNDSDGDSILNEIISGSIKEGDYLATDGTTLIWSSTLAGVYNNNITVIGRDDAEGLLQKQSKSVNANALVTVGKSQIASTNAANSATFALDKDYLAFADDSGPITSFNLAGAPVNRQILTRKWLVQETGTDSADYQISVPDNSSVLSNKLPGEYGSVYILQDADGDFTSGATEISMTLNGTNWEVSNIDLDNGQFFTFASQIPPTPGGVANGLQLWLPAENYSGGSSWLDRSTNARTVTKVGTVPHTELYNFQAVPSNLGLNYFTTPHNASLDANNGAISIFAVEKHINTGTYNAIAAKTNNSGWDSGWVLASSTPSTDIGFTTGDWAGIGITNVAKISGASLTNINLLSAFGNGATTNVVSISNFGAQEVTNTSTKTTSPTPLTLGYDNYSYSLGGGSIGEFILYNSSLNSNEKLRIQSYLAAKFGLTLDQTTPQDYLASDGSTVFWNSSINAGYKNNITVIGRDDKEQLTQKQSKSVNTNALVTIGKSEIVSTNAANMGTFAIDKDYLSIGDDNGSIATFSASGAPVNKKIIARKWKVQETGTDAVDYKIQLPGDTVGITSSAAVKLPFAIKAYILVDSDGDFTSGAVETEMIYDSLNKVWNVIVDLDNTQFFTFATTIPSFTSGTGLSLNENANGTISVVLNAQPGSNVVIAATSALPSVVTVSPAHLTFTTSNWNIPQNITVNAINDANAINEDVNVTFSVVDASSSDEFDTLVDQISVVNVIDDDIASVVFTPVDNLTSEDLGTGSFNAVLTSQPSANVVVNLQSDDSNEGLVQASITFTPLNWNIPQNITVTGVNDSVPTSDGTRAYSIGVSSITGDSQYAALLPATYPSVAMQNQDNDAPGVVIEIEAGSGDINHTTEGGDTAILRFTLLARPAGGGDVTIPLSLSDTSEADLGSDSITILNANWNNPALNEIIVKGVNDLEVDGDIVYSVITGTVTSTDPAYDNYDGIGIADPVLTNIDDEIAGFTILESSGTTTMSEPFTDHFTIELNAQPQTDVVINLSSSDTTAVTINPVSLTFTNADWNSPQTVIVSAVDDADGVDESAIITANIYQVSTDPLFDTVSSQIVNVTVIDNDVPGLTLIESAGNTNITEGGSTDTYTFVLNTEPTSNVNVALTAGTEANVSPSSAIFTALNWNVPQVITVTAVDDLKIEGMHSQLISHVISSSDSSYNLSTLADVIANIVDNDTPPTPITAPNLQDGSDLGSSNSDDVTSDTRPSFDVECTVLGSTINLYNGTTLIGTATCGSTGTITISVSVDLSEGSYSIHYNETQSGVTGQNSPAISISIDTSAPVSPVVTFPSLPSNVTDGTVSGTGTAGDTVVVTANPGGSTCTAVVQLDGSWSCELSPVPSTSPVSLSIVETDPAGNSSNPTVVGPVAIDTTSPSSPSITSVGGDTTVPYLVNDTTPEVVISTEVGDSVTIAGWTCTPTPATGSSVSCTPDAALSEGSHDFTPVICDAAGNCTTGSVVTTLVDTTSPTSPSVTFPVSPSNVTDGTVSGTGTAGDTVVVTSNPGGSTCTAVVQLDGSWSCELSPIPSTSPVSLSIVETDPAGNSSNPTVVGPVAIDTTSPTKPIINTPVTNPISGTGTPGDTLTITTPSGSTCVIVIPVNGSWTCTLIPAPLIGESLTIVTTDPAGNSLNPFVVAVDTDGDGVSDIDEAVAPNGDGNGDGILDSMQLNVTTIKNVVTNSYTTMKVTGGCMVINGFNIVTEASRSVNDINFEYPLGLNDFKLTCSAPGLSSDVTFYYDKQYDTANWKYRKYSPISSTYSDLNSFINYGIATVNGKVVTTAMLKVTDGGAGDQDGIVNSSITDPSGAAQPVILPQTGSVYMLYIQYLCIVSLLMILIGVRCNDLINK